MANVLYGRGCNAQGAKTSKERFTFTDEFVVDANHRHLCNI
jgi:hypothetical protein